MSAPAWHEPAWQRLRAARREGRLAHALLFCGEPGLGQGELAQRLFAALLCTQPTEGAACGRCRSCELRVAGTHADAQRIGLLTRDDGRLRTEIGVDQIRQLSAAFALSTRSGVQVALIDPADAMNANAANALLKTLEEPHPGRVLLLVAEQARRLPITVRSRCQLIELRAPGAVAAKSALLARGHAEVEIDSVLALTDAHPGLAEAILAADGSLLQREVRDDLRALGRGRGSATEVASRWAADRLPIRLQLAALACREFARRRIADRDSGLTVGLEFSKLVAWFDAANRLRAQLAAPLRHELLLADLLIDWPASNNF